MKPGSVLARDALTSLDANEADKKKFPSVTGMLLHVVCNSWKDILNPIREYELNLRGYKIGLIENMGTTLNQFDTIDFTDNDIRRLDGFPILPKIKSLLFSNNKVQ